MMQLKLDLQPEIDVVDSHGNQIRPKCSHDLIPGLDADYCRQCRTWWVDREIRDRYLPRREKQAKAKREADDRERKKPTLTI